MLTIFTSAQCISGYGCARSSDCRGARFDNGYSENRGSRFIHRLISTQKVTSPPGRSTGSLSNYCVAVEPRTSRRADIAGSHPNGRGYVDSTYWPNEISPSPADPRHKPATSRRVRQCSRYRSTRCIAPVCTGIFGGLHYTAGSGLSEGELKRLSNRLRPELVAEVQFTSWSGSGHVCQAVYLG
jgi:hypothetical protein